MAEAFFSSLWRIREHLLIGKQAFEFTKYL